MRWSAVAGGIASMCLAVSAIMFGAPLIVFFDVITVLLVLLFPVGFMVEAHGVSGLRTVRRAARCWLGSDNRPPEQLDDARCVVETGAKATTRGAIICVMIGAIQMLQAGALTNVEHIGPAMAVMLLSYFYAHCLNYIFWGPLGRWLAQHAGGREAGRVHNDRALE